MPPLVDYNHGVAVADFPQLHTLCLPIRSSVILINVSAGMPMMVPSLILAWCSFVLTRNLVSSAYSQPLDDVSAGYASSSMFWFTSTVGVGFAGAV